ncbi:MAG: peptide chain release factor N(5)-glutamine methyltransferase [Clostridia bacterium]|nr:peptide chain release factor N(5)-glutamine methyltransferase [Clostridia bacterium]
MTLSEIIKELEAGGVESPRFDASVLIEHFEGKSRAVQLAFPEKDYTSDSLATAVNRRKNREPLQYIIGEWEFMGHTFKVSPNCLIPRADTELLCSLAIDRLKDTPDARFADLCTGSGCIAISVLCECESASGVAVELYPETLQICAENAVRNHVADRLHTVLGDVCSNCLEGEFDVIVSNPPYVTIEEMKDITPEVAMEPPHALTDGGDGLSIIRKILEIYPSKIKKNGILAIEFGWKQGPAILEIAKSLNLNAHILKDTENRDRVLVVNI